MRKGKFVVIEGVDCVGKSSIIKAALRKLDDRNIVGNLGFRRDTLWGRAINRHPKSIQYYVDFALKTRFQIKPLLDEGAIVLQDRYVQTVDTYAPDCKWRHNQVARRVLSGLFLNPDLYVQITCDAEEMLRRLRESDDQESYHKSLVKNPQIVYDRLARYKEVYEGINCEKRVLDTTNKSAKESAKELIEMIEEV